MAHVVILGAGQAGSAFAVPLADRGHAVTLVGAAADAAVVAALGAGRPHPGLGDRLPAAVRVRDADGLPAALAGAVDLLVIGVSTAGIPWAIERLAALAALRCPLLLLTKGLASDGERIAILSSLVQERLAAAGRRCLVGGIGGPCIARELAARQDTSVVIGYPDAAVLAGLIELLNTPYYHVRASEDLVGVEASAALKNLFALGVGAAIGSETAAHHNPVAGLFSQALAELALLVEALGGRRETVMGLAGAGDLYVTCQGGRNGQMGRLLGSGYSYRRAKRERMPEATIEGAELAFAIAPVLRRWWQTGRLDPAALPLTRAIIDALLEDRPLAVPWTYCNR